QMISRAIDSIMLEAAAARPAGSLSEVSSLRTPSSASAAVDALFADGIRGDDSAASQAGSEGNDLNLLGAGLLNSLPFLGLPRRRQHQPVRRAGQSTKQRQHLGYDS